MYSAPPGWASARSAGRARQTSVAVARLARADGERRREPGQQRRVPEALAGLEHVDDRARRGRGPSSRCATTNSASAGAPSSTSAVRALRVGPRGRGAATVREHVRVEAGRTAGGGRGTPATGRGGRSGVDHQVDRHVARAAPHAMGLLGPDEVAPPARCAAGRRPSRSRRSPGARASLTIRLAPARVPTTRPSRVDALALQAPDRLVDVVRALVPLAPRRHQPRVGEAEDGAPDRGRS